MATEKLRRSVPVLFGALFGTSTLVALGAFVGGCENPTAKADKTIDQQVEAAQAKDATPADRKALIAALDAAGKVPNASAAAKVEVKLEQARLELDGADDAARVAGADEIEIARLAGQVQSLTGQISSNNLLIDGLRKREPVDALKGVDDAVAAAKGSGDTATWGAADKGVPAGSAVDAETARINADIQKLTSERATLDTKQKQNSDDARKLEQQAAKAHGVEARDAGIKAANLRRDARTANMRMDQIDRAVAGLQDQLTVQAARKAALADADKAYADRKTQIAAGWDELKKQIDVYQDQSKKLLEGNGNNSDQPTTAPAAPTTQPKIYDPSSDADMAVVLRDANVTRLGMLIQQKVAQYDTDRQSAFDKYDVAYNHFKDAQQLAEQVVKGLPKLVTEKEAASGLAEQFGPNDYKLRLAAIRLKQAQLHAEQADTIAVLDDTRTALSATLEKASLQMPKEFTGLPPGSTVADLRKTSDDQYNEAETTLEEVAQPGTTARAKSDQVFARQMQVAAAYARAKDAQRAGDTAKAETQLTNAKNVLEALNQETPVPDSLYLTPELASAIRQPPKLAPLVLNGPTSAPSGAPGSPLFGGGTPAPTTGPSTAPSDTTPPTTAPSDTTQPATPAAPDSGTPPATPATPATPAAPDSGTTPPTPPATPATPAAPDSGTTPPATPATPATPPAPDAGTPPATPAAPGAGTTPPPAPTPPAPGTPEPPK